MDVTPLTLGIATFGDMTSKIIARNTTVPTQKTKSFTNIKDWQERVKIIITQGESRYASENVFLGEIV